MLIILENFGLNYCKIFGRVINRFPQSGWAVYASPMVKMTLFDILGPCC
jgi:hypothetical protein